MLEGLDAIGWHDLEHAYGPADDVPGLLRDLISADEETRHGAQYELYGTIYHQGTIYSATAHAVPFLIALAASDTTPDRGWILGYLASVARGTSFIEVHQHSPVFPDLAAERRTAEVEAQHQQQLADVRRTRAAVREGIPLYLQLLNHDDAEVREGAAAVLARFPEESERSRLALQERLNVEDDQDDRAQLIFSLGALRPHQSERLDLYTKALAEEVGIWTRAKLAMTLVRDFGNAAPGEAITVLMDALPGIAELQRRCDHLSEVEPSTRPTVRLAYSSTSGGNAQTALPGMEPLVKPPVEPDEALLRVAEDMQRLSAIASLYPNLYTIAEGLRKINAERLLKALGMLLATFEEYCRLLRPLHPCAINLANTLLYAAFQERPVSEGTAVGDLTDSQRAVLAAVSKGDIVWRYHTNMAVLLKLLGLPHQRQELQQFLSA